MYNKSLKKCDMPIQDANERNKNFLEVELGYTQEQAVEEAQRCLNCKNKDCVAGCPVNIDIPKFITEVANKQFDDAYNTILKSNSLPAVCGRVCPQETQCESRCVRGIKGEPVGIGRLERFVGDYYGKNNNKPIEEIKKNNKKVAIIGSGPSGLACAGELVQYGYDITIFEALHITGGVLLYGIPEFRLPKEVVKKEIDALIQKGVKIQKNVVIGKTITIDELIEEYKFDAVFIGTGAGLPKFMNIKGENLKGVYSANEYLTRVNLMKSYLDNSDTPIKKSKKVAVVGGGNVAMDAARSAIRLGAKEVYIIYRRSMAELPARVEEIKHAEEEGIIFKILTNPIEIMSDELGNVKAIKCVEMELGEPDNSGRRRPIVKENSEFEIELDTVIMSIGTSPNPLIKSTTNGLDTNKWGGVVVEKETGRTTKDSVYAGGDVVTGAATVILAMEAGKKSGNAIHKKLS